MLVEKALYRKEDLREEQGEWYSLMHHSTFSSHEAEDCLQKINQRITQGHENLHQADWIILHGAHLSSIPGKKMGKL